MLIDSNIYKQFGKTKGGKMDKVIAFSSFSIMKKPYGDPLVAGFESLTPPVFQVAE
jgi:hypothetical protein